MIRPKGLSQPLPTLLDTSTFDPVLATPFTKVISVILASAAATGALASEVARVLVGVDRIWQPADANADKTSTRDAANVWFITISEWGRKIYARQ